MRAATCSNVWMIYSSLFSVEKVALQSVNLEIESDQVYGLLGPNGAGKTTLISLMATLLTPTRGSIEIMGMDTQKQTKKIREKINITSGNPNLIWSLTAYENLKYCALSYGMNILDLQRERGITVILTTHYMNEAEMMCDRIAFINNGHIVAEGNQRDLKSLLKMKDRVAIKVDRKIPQIQVDGIHYMEVENQTYTFYVDNSEKRLGDLVEEVSKHARIKNIAVKEVDLEDVFTELAK